MSKRAIVISVFVILALVGLVLAVVHFMSPAQPSSGTTSGNTGNGFGTSPGGTSGSTGGVSGGTLGNTLTIPTANGGTVSVPDFRANSPSVREGNATYYALTSNQDTQGENAQFDIQYGSDNSITVALLHEPLGAARLAAEQSLRTFFPLSDDQLCSLGIVVAVPVRVNETYAGQNLGLSFCPNSVPLP